MSKKPRDLLPYRAERKAALRRIKRVLRKEKILRRKLDAKRNLP